MSPAQGLPAGWDYSPERRPPRVLVPAPEPQGVGGDQVEAFSSWLARTAVGVDLAPGLFARYVLAPALGRSDVEGASTAEWGVYFAAIFRKVRGSIDGLGQLARTWTSVLAELTGRADLPCLTALPWAAVLPATGLTGRVRRVCPVCLGDEPSGGEIPYEPLVWRVRLVEACFAHAVPVRLRSNCPQCGADSPVIGTWSLPGRCAGCGAWLGMTKADALPRQRPLEGAEAAWQRFVDTEVRLLIRDGQHLERVPTLATTAAAVALAIQRAGSMTRLAADVGVSVSLVSLWAAGRRQPSLAPALRLCAVAGFHLADLYAGRLEDLRAAEPRQGRLQLPAISRRRIRWDRVEEALRAARASDPPPSLGSVLAPFGVERREAHRKFPELAAEIRDRRAAWRVLSMQTLRRSRERTIRRETRALWARGVYPARNLVERRLPHGVWLRDPSNRAAWKATLRELGLL